MKKILIISPGPLHPIINGSRTCTLSYCNMLKELNYDVYFLWINNYSPYKEDESISSAYWKEKQFIFYKSNLHRLIEFFSRSLNFGNNNYNKLDSLCPIGISKFIKEIKSKHHFDCVIINYIFLSKIFDLFPASKKILFTHDAFTNKFQKTGDNWFSVRPEEEMKALNRADEILAIQENEAVFFSYLTNKKIQTTFSYFPIVKTEIRNNQTLLILSGKNKYNVEGVSYFISVVFDKILVKFPDIKLIIGGAICSEIQKISNNKNITLYGIVDELLDFYKLGDICINPINNGTGLKIKSFEALSYGKPLICDSHNIIGIYKKETAPILIANSPEEYINQIEYLFLNNNLLEFKNKTIKYINELNQEVQKCFVQAIEN